MQPHSFSKRQLAAIALMLEEEKNAALNDKKKRMWAGAYLGLGSCLGR